MKKLYVVFVLIFLSGTFSGFAQVSRDMVIVEIATGTWCQYCPGSAMGADDLIANGHDVAIIEYHNGDPYANTYSNYRNNYYSVTGYPTANFDGVISVVGGSTSQTMYPQYLSRYNQRIGVDSPFTIDITGENYGVTDFEATITIEKVAANSSSNLVLHFVLTESHIEESWQGMSELNFVERLMAPDQYGTDLDFSGGDIQEVIVNFSLENDWVYENCEVVAFVQDASTKEIFQGTKMDLTEFDFVYDYDASVTAIRNIPLESCMNEVAPVVTIRNNTETPLTSLDLEYNVNGGNLITHQWTGSLGLLETADVELPSSEFSPEVSNNVMVNSMNPNGQADQYDVNNSLDEDFGLAESIPMEVTFMLRTDSNPEETTWELTNSQGEVVHSGGPYSSGNQMQIENWDLAEDCYNLSVYDEGGDGLTGAAFFMLYYGENIVIWQGSDFDYQISNEFSADIVGIAENTPDFEMNVFPNPVYDEANISFTLTENKEVVYRIYDLVGSKVMELKQNHNAGYVKHQLDVSSLGKGIYLLNLQIGDHTLTKKITVLN